MIAVQHRWGWSFVWKNNWRKKGWKRFPWFSAAKLFFCCGECLFVYFETWFLLWYLKETLKIDVLVWYSSFLEDKVFELLTTRKKNNCITSIIATAPSCCKNGGCSELWRKWPIYIPLKTSTHNVPAAKRGIFGGGSFPGGYGKCANMWSFPWKLTTCPLKINAWKISKMYSLLK